MKGCGTKKVVKKAFSKKTAATKIPKKFGKSYGAFKTKDRA